MPSSAPHQARSTPPRPRPAPRPSSELAIQPPIASGAEPAAIDDLEAFLRTQQNNELRAVEMNKFYMAHPQHKGAGVKLKPKAIATQHPNRFVWEQGAHQGLSTIRLQRGRMSAVPLATSASDKAQAVGANSISEPTEDHSGYRCHLCAGHADPRCVC